MVLQVIKQVDGSCLLFDIEGRNFLYHSCFATCLIDIEMYKGTCVAAEYDLIGRVLPCWHEHKINAANTSAKAKTSFVNVY